MALTKKLRTKLVWIYYDTWQTAKNNHAINVACDTKLAVLYKSNGAIATTQHETCMRHEQMRVRHMLLYTEKNKQPTDWVRSSFTKSKV